MNKTLAANSTVPKTIIRIEKITWRTYFTSFTAPVLAKLEEYLLCIISRAHTCKTHQHTNNYTYMHMYMYMYMHTDMGTIMYHNPSHCIRTFVYTNTCTQRIPIHVHILYTCMRASLGPGPWPYTRTLGRLGPRLHVDIYRCTPPMYLIMYIEQLSASVHPVSTTTYSNYINRHILNMAILHNHYYNYTDML